MRRGRVAAGPDERRGRGEARLRSTTPRNARGRARRAAVEGKARSAKGAMEEGRWSDEPVDSGRDREREFDRADREKRVERGEERKGEMERGRRRGE